MGITSMPMTASSWRAEQIYGHILDMVTTAIGQERLFADVVDDGRSDLNTVELVAKKDLLDW